MKDKKLEPWDQSMYRTGTVEPPRKHGALMVLLLIAVIVLAGIVTILSVMNVRLFTQLKVQKSELSLSLQPTDRTDRTSLHETETKSPSEEIIQLQPVPNSSGDSSTGNGLSLQQIYARCIDSVVSISCTWEDSSSCGTGVVVTENGYIVTNSHVVENASQITVRLSDDRTLNASVIGCDSTTDLAVIQIPAGNLMAAQFGSSEELQVGDAVCAIGDPLGVELRGTLTDGIISAINRKTTADGRPMTLLQTNAAPNPGHAGSPLINSYGQVIGISAQVEGYAGNADVGFAVPSAVVKNVVDQLILQGYVSGRPFVGITGEGVSEVHQILYQLPAGLFITDITMGSDAEAKGLAQGDILISIGGHKVTDVEDLTQALYRYEIGDAVQVEIFRNNKHYVVELTVEEDKG